LDLFDRDNFNRLRAAIFEMTNKKDAAPDEVQIKYGLKDTTYYLLLTSAEIVKSKLLEKKGREEQALEVDRFLIVLCMLMLSSCGCQVSYQPSCPTC
jgi:hypothetical protein